MITPNEEGTVNTDAGSTDAGVVIIGAGLGGTRLASELRQGGYEGPITLLGEERHAPYDRPPLSKAVLIGHQDSTDLNPIGFYDEVGIELRTGTRAIAVHPETRSVTVQSVSDGSRETLTYAALVVATGLRPRTLACAAGRDGVHVLRTIDDALALRAESSSAARAVVVGAGFVGCEVAASLRTQGLDVVVVEPSPAPLAASLGERVGAMVGRILKSRGVEVRTGVSVAAVEGIEKVTGVTLSDGTHVAADLVVIGIGSTPVVEFLAGSGIDLVDSAEGGGIACDAAGRTTVPDVYALGDVANWLDERGERSRVEHWNNVITQVRAVAGSILGAATDPAATVPYFWSDQFDVKVQALGHPSAHDDVHIVFDDNEKFVVYYSHDDVLTSVVGAGKPAAVMKMRAKLLAKTRVRDLLDEAVTPEAQVIPVGR